jgi:hypothetical protein
MICDEKREQARGMEERDEKEAGIVKRGVKERRLPVASSCVQVSLHCDELRSQIRNVPSILPEYIHKIKYIT